jgi:hypothetical protein
LSALSFPEMVILRSVMTARLVAVFVGAAGIFAVGYLFNFLFSRAGTTLKTIKGLGPGCKRCQTTVDIGRAAENDATTCPISNFSQSSGGSASGAKPSPSPVSGCRLGLR